MNNTKCDHSITSDLQRLSAKFFIILILSALIFMAQKVKSEIGASNEPFFGKVKLIGPNDSIAISGHGNFRVWGVIPIGHGLETLIDQNILCSPVGTVTAKATTVVVTCIMGFGDTFFESPSADQQDVSKFLISNGHAQEFCAETLGLYGTCITD